jgi:uncharacterized protein YqjF (DUF2071 family)
VRRGYAAACRPMRSSQRSAPNNSSARPSTLAERGMTISTSEDLASTCPRPFLTAEWRDLVMLNFEVPEALLRPRVPPGTELDAYGGVHLVTLVGFRFLNTRVLGLPVPGHRNFDEINLRFYVRRRGPDGEWRRGVTFVREFVPRWAVAAVARWVYNEPYRPVPMRHEILLADADAGRGGRATYAWRVGGRWHRLGVTVQSRPSLPAAGSEAAFVVEHYWGYTPQRDGGCREYHVAHPPWRTSAAAAGTLDCDVRAVYGDGFAECLAGPPRSALLAEGSRVAVHAGRPLGRTA